MTVHIKKALPSMQLSDPSSANEHYTYVLTKTELILVWEQPLEASDSGVYECIGKNSHGERRASVNLTVIGKLCIPVLLDTT